MLDVIKHITYDIFFFQDDSALVHMHCVCTTQSNCCSALDFLSLKPSPNSPDQNASITRLRESCIEQREYESWVKKRLKKSSSNWLNSGNALIHDFSEKNAIFMFPCLPGSAEAHVIWGGIVKRFLIHYFMRNISATKYQNAFTYVKIIANQRWDVFETVYLI